MCDRQLFVTERGVSFCTVSRQDAVSYTQFGDFLSIVKTTRGKKTLLNLSPHWQIMRQQTLCKKLPPIKMQTQLKMQSRYTPYFFFYFVT